MRVRMDIAERRRRLMRRHHLASPSHDLVTVTGDLVGLHATDPVSIFLAARARTATLQTETVERALYDDRTLVKTLAMRRTLFVVPTDSLPVLQAAVSNDIAANERRRLAKFLQDQGMCDDGDPWIERVGALALEALRDRGEALTSQLTGDVPELARTLVLSPGKSYQATVSIGSRLLLVLAAEGRVVRGRPRGTWISTQYRWAPMDTWVGRVEALPAAEARAELARSWLRSFGPATEGDLKWWTGWTLGQTRAALAALGAIEVELDDSPPGFVLPGDLEPEPEPATAPGVALLPALDPTAMGWQARQWYVGQHKARLFDNYGNIGPTVWADGRIVGCWGQRKNGAVVTALLEDIGAEAAGLVDEEAERLTAWLHPIRFVPRFRSPLERELSA